MAEPNETASDDHDSAIEASDDEASSTASLSLEAMEYVHENHRRYHAVCPGFPHLQAYPYPNDEREQGRLEALHHLLIALFQGKLYHAPLSQPHHILDLGTGTGHWAIEVADAHPEAVVVGTDISPIQPSWVPHNCRFEMSDLEDSFSWHFKQEFNLIFGRWLLGSLRDASRLCKLAIERLAPGGWLEFHEPLLPTSDDGTLPQNSELQKWINKFRMALSHESCEPDLAKKYEAHLKTAGFVHVTKRKYKLPQGSWDSNSRDLGTWHMIALLDGLEALSLRLFTKSLKMSLEEVHVHLAGVRADLANANIHVYWPMYVTPRPAHLVC